MRQLATGAGVSPALISQVERGINDPSLDSLRRIAQALNVPLFDFFQQPEDGGVAVIRADARTQLRSPHGDLTYTRLSPGYAKVEVLEGILKPGGCSSELPWSHPSEECAVVISGRMTVEVDGDRRELEPGDSCYFDSTAAAPVREQQERPGGLHVVGHAAKLLRSAPPAGQRFR